MRVISAKFVRTVVVGGYCQTQGNRVYCNAGFDCFYLVTPRVLTVHATHNLLVVLAVLVVLKILAVLGPRNSSLLTFMFGKSFPVRSIVPGKAPEDVNMAQLNDNMFVRGQNLEDSSADHIFNGHHRAKH